MRAGRAISRLGAIVAILGVALLWLAPQASARIDDRATALSQYESALADGKVVAGWTGSTSSCNVGTESGASLDATRDTVNVLRDFAGLGPVAFSAEKNHRALAAALMMKAQNDLSHDPPPSWACYSDEGRLGASTSNLFLGSSGSDAMVGFVDDGGVDSLGHRRWILDPTAVEFGSGSTGTTNALVVLDNGGDGLRAASVPADSAIAWPPSGYFPTPWIFEDWSVALGNDSTQGDVSVAGANVRVTVDGSSAQVSDVRDLGTGFGTGTTLTWKVALPASVQSGDHEIDVSVNGVLLSGGPFPVSYTVKAFNPDPSGGGATSAKCKRAKAKLKRAKAKLAKAKQKGAPAKVKKAKRRVMKKRKQKKRACSA